MSNDKDKKLEDSKISKDKEHTVKEHDAKKDPRDHYHDVHHFNSKGEHDDVEDSDFYIKHSFKYSKTNLTFKISLSGVILALSVVATGIDIFLERFTKIPIEGVFLSLRYLDIIVVILSIGLLGPVFASSISFLVPWLHLLMDPDHGPIAEGFDSIAYFLVVWILWLIYYVFFRNSYIHKHPNKKIDLIRRWLPTPFFAISAALLFTFTFLISVYITNIGSIESKSSMNINNYLLNSRHEDHGDHHHHHDHEHEVDWGQISSRLPFYGFVIFGIQFARFLFLYIIFASLEPQFKKINHRFL